MHKFGHNSEELLLNFAINMIIITTVILWIGENWKKIIWWLATSHFLLYCCRLSRQVASESGSLKVFVLIPGTSETKKLIQHMLWVTRYIVSVHPGGSLKGIFLADSVLDIISKLWVTNFIKKSGRLSSSQWVFCADFNRYLQKAWKLTGWFLGEVSFPWISLYIWWGKKKWEGNTCLLNELNFD